MSTKIYSVDCLPDRILLGRQTENGARQVRIDCQPWLAQWPELNIEIWVTPAVGDPYPVMPTMDGDTAVWTISSADTAHAGDGTMEVIGLLDGVKTLSVVTMTYVTASTTAVPGTTPEAYQGWVDQVLAAGAEAAESAELAAVSEAKAAEHSTAAAESARQAEEGNQAAKGAAGEAAGSAEAAERSAEAATTSEGNAAASATAAAGSAAEAATSEGNASASAEEAATSAGNASASAESAAASAAQAQTVLNSIPEDYKSTVDQVAKLAPAIMVDASGNTVTVTDAAARPVPFVVTTVEPSTIGHDALHVYRTGKNLSELGTVTFTRTKEAKLTVPIPAGTYTMSAVISSDDTDSTKCNVHFFSDGAVQLKRLFGRSKDGKRIVQEPMTFAKDITSIYFYASDNYNAGTGDKASFADIQIEQGSTATVYEPYTSQTLTAALPETVHGGTMDWTSGVLTVTHDADGAELAEPRTIQLNPQTLETIKGVNHVWSDAGSTSMTYVADTKLYIDNAIAAIAANIINA